MPSLLIRGAALLAAALWTPGVWAQAADAPPVVVVPVPVPTPSVVPPETQYLYVVPEGSRYGSRRQSTTVQPVIIETVPVPFSGDGRATTIITVPPGGTSR